MDEVRFAKDRLFSDISGLEKIEVDDNVKEGGGLEGLRKWLDEKKELLSPEKKAVLRAKGLQPPTGLCRCNSQLRVHASIRIVATRTFRRIVLRRPANRRRKTGNPVPVHAEISERCICGGCRYHRKYQRRIYRCRPGVDRPRPGIPRHRKREFYIE